MKRKQLLNGLKEKWRYRKLKEEALDRILSRTRSERGSNYRKTDKRDDDDDDDDDDGGDDMILLWTKSQLINTFHKDTTKSKTWI